MTSASMLRWELDAAEHAAWKALARYKFVMFGYWCGVWVHLNRVGQFRRANPWAKLVSAARQNLAREYGDTAGDKAGAGAPR